MRDKLYMIDCLSLLYGPTIFSLTLTICHMDNYGTNYVILCSLRIFLISLWYKSIYVCTSRMIRYSHPYADQKDTF